MKLPVTNNPFMTEVFRILEREDSQNVKKNRNIEMGDNQLILTSPDGSRYALVVDNAGALSTVAV